MALPDKFRELMSLLASRAGKSRSPRKIEAARRAAAKGRAVIEARRLSKRDGVQSETASRVPESSL
jgi:hypothetical protein